MFQSSNPVRVSRETLTSFLIFSEELRFAHYSVKEYLVSTRILHRESSIYAVSGGRGHHLVAQLSLIYLLSFENMSPFEISVLDRFPLLSYAAQFWHEHIHASANEGYQSAEPDLVVSLFNSNSYNHWLTVNDPDQPDMGFGANVYARASNRLYYSSLLGLFRMTRWLLDRGADVNAVMGGRLHLALIAAAENGHTAVVRLLLEHGAEINTNEGWHGNALRAAAINDRESVVRLLLEKGADVNARGDRHNETALEGAVEYQYYKIIELLKEYRVRGGEMK